MEVFSGGSERLCKPLCDLDLDFFFYLAIFRSDLRLVFTTPRFLLLDNLVEYFLVSFLCFPVSRSEIRFVLFNFYVLSFNMSSTVTSIIFLMF